MSLNDKDYTLGPGKSNDTWPGLANPTAMNRGGDPIRQNFVDDPTTDATGAGAEPNFEGHRMAKKALAPQAGVVEARPGIIETTNIDPLNENSNKDDGWANAKATPGKGAFASTTETAGAMYDAATTRASGAAKAAYGTVTGDLDTKEEGMRAFYGSNAGSS